MAGARRHRLGRPPGIRSGPGKTLRCKHFVPAGDRKAVRVAVVTRRTPARNRGLRALLSPLERLLL